MKKIIDVCYNAETGQCLDIYLPECRSFPVFLYFHGGGLEAGSKTDVMKISGFIHDAGQPTCHFNILRERGIDTRRVIIDESSPIYHIDGKGQYPPMLIIVSDNDMENRYEQTMLLVSTLKHFGYSDKVKLKIMNGGHCAYIAAEDESEESVFGKIIAEFINEVKR